MTLDDLVQINKDAFIKVGDTALLGVILPAIPFLGTPAILPLTTKAVNWIITKLADTAEMGVFFVFTDMRVSTQGSTYITSVQAAEAETDPVKKAALEEVANENFKSLVKFNQ